MDVANTILWLQTCWLALTLRYGFHMGDDEFHPSVFGVLMWIAIAGLNIYLFTLDGSVL